MKQLKVTALAALAASAAATAQAGGAPSDAVVRQLILNHYAITPGQGSRMEISLVQLSPGHRASAQEGMQYQVSLGRMIYPVRTRYTLISGEGRYASYRDWDTHWFVFRSAQMHGNWDLTSDSHKGDVEGNLRGG